MSIKVTGAVTLEEVIPIVNRLNEVEQEELRQFLESKTHINWKTEWGKVVAYFHKIFEKFPEEEIEADLERALNEVRSGQTD